MKSSYKHIYRNGTTLLELIVALSIIYVFSSIALTSSGNFFSGDAMTVAASKLTTDIRIARYSSMQNQTYTRLIFSSDKTAWEVQEAIDGNGDAIVGQLPPEFDNAVINDYDDNTHWETIIDDDEHEVDPDIDIQFSPSAPPAIVFRPDGTLAQGPGIESRPIGTVEVKFIRDDSHASVFITPSGALESLEYYDKNY